ncbi:MAG: response regulator [Planctomycetales bacterium]|nr:response regulator [Planctomycetales bacterium]NIM10305.1 response regulator [Planctomycetales bacterium]NIN09744.1 response regulator [Planctomycetales bacterium]NIN78869.1 response regulator [Planctomycetales bacterium]NIO36036.1 response regulator [Planctomycetales bacterium]
MPQVLVVDKSPTEQERIAGLLARDENLQVQAVGSGFEALQQIQQYRPDLVITDMEMPDTDGLELLRQINVHHSDIPVIFMTRLDSEAMAVEALQAGATSYVPKAQLDDSLFDMVHQVLAILEANRHTTELMKCLKETFFEFEIESDPALIEPLVQLVLHSLGGLHINGESKKLQMGVALEQALLNALYRGNLEITSDQLEAAREDQLRGINRDPVAERRGQAPYGDRKIHVAVSLSPQTVRLVVRDEGPGFDVNRVATLSTAATSEQQADRGLLLMKTVMDEVFFNEQGNQVTLIKHLANGC